MSMIFQSYALWPHMTVFENVAYGLRAAEACRAPRSRGGSTSILAVTRARRRSPGRYPGELSGGQQQRVSLARALVVEPEILLLDEPLSNLDANLREEMRFEIRRLHDAYRYTTVYVTHDQAEAMTTADLIVVMNQGRHRAGRHARGHLRAPALGIRRALHRRHQHPQGHAARRRRGRLRRRSCCAAAAASSPAGGRRRRLRPPPRHPARDAKPPRDGHQLGRRHRRRARSISAPIATIWSSSPNGETDPHGGTRRSSPSTQGNRSGSTSRRSTAARSPH